MTLFTMTYHGILLGVVIGSACISGVACSGYEVGGIVGGLVASCVIGFLILLAAIVMILMAVLWRDWYMERQATLGHFRKPREDWTFFKPKSTISALSTPVSERKFDIRMHDLASMPESRLTTMSRNQLNEGGWTARVPVSNAFEEKSKTMQFEPEDEAVIETEILPDATQQRNTRSNQSYQTTQFTTSQNEMYVPWQGLRNTQPARPNEPYHVRAGRISAADVSPEDIVIMPLVDETKAEDFNGTTMVLKDSDDEAGNIQNDKEDMVLF